MSELRPFSFPVNTLFSTKRSGLRPSISTCILRISTDHCLLDSTCHLILKSLKSQISSTPDPAQDEHNLPDKVSLKEQ